MPFYTPIEHRERAQQFDSFVGAGLEVLDNPSVAQVFQPTDLEGIRSILDTAILPNVRHHKISIPLSKIMLNSVAIVPADNELFTRTDTLARRSLTWLPISREYYGETTYSPRYGQHFARKPEQASPGNSDAAPVTEASNAADAQTLAMASTSAYHYYPRKEGGAYAISRPLITFRTALLGEPPDLAASLAIHESVHCQDYVEHGPIVSIRYLAATELRAYQASFAVAEEYGQTNDKAGVIRSVERARRKRQTADQPYNVDDKLVAWMLKKGIVVPAIY